MGITRPPTPLRVLMSFGDTHYGFRAVYTVGIDLPNQRFSQTRIPSVGQHKMPASGKDLPVSYRFAHMK